MMRHTCLIFRTPHRKNLSEVFSLLTQNSTAHFFEQNFIDSEVPGSQGGRASSVTRSGSPARRVRKPVLIKLIRSTLEVASLHHGSRRAEVFLRPGKAPFQPARLTGRRPGWGAEGRGQREAGDAGAATVDTQLPASELDLKPCFLGMS